jgi:hypothetical protein
MRGLPVDTAEKLLITPYLVALRWPSRGTGGTGNQLMFRCQPMGRCTFPCMVEQPCHVHDDVHVVVLRLVSRGPDLVVILRLRPQPQLVHGLVVGLSVVWGTVG